MMTKLTESFQQEWKSFKTDFMQSTRDAFRDNNGLILQEIRAVKVELRKNIQIAKEEVIDVVDNLINGAVLSHIDGREQHS